MSPISIQITIPLWIVAFTVVMGIQKKGNLNYRKSRHELPSSTTCLSCWVSTRTLEKGCRKHQIPRATKAVTALPIRGDQTPLSQLRNSVMMKTIKAAEWLLPAWRRRWTTNPNQGCVHRPLFPPPHQRLVQLAMAFLRVTKMAPFPIEGAPDCIIATTMGSVLKTRLSIPRTRPLCITDFTVLWSSCGMRTPPPLPCTAARALATKAILRYAIHPTNRKLVPALPDMRWWLQTD